MQSNPTRNPQIPWCECACVSVCVWRSLFTALFVLCACVRHKCVHGCVAHGSMSRPAPTMGRTGNGRGPRRTPGRRKRWAAQGLISSVGWGRAKVLCTVPFIAISPLHIALLSLSLFFFNAPSPIRLPVHSPTHLFAHSTSASHNKMNMCIAGIDFAFFLHVCVPVTGKPEETAVTSRTNLVCSLRSVATARILFRDVPHAFLRCCGCFFVVDKMNHRMPHHRTCVRH